MDINLEGRTAFVSGSTKGIGRAIAAGLARAGAEVVVNGLSGVRLARRYLPGMTERGWGRVQFIASDSAVVIPAEMVHYGMTKTALLAVSRGFAKAAAGTGVTVNTVMAGPTHTEGVEDFVYQLVGKDLPWDEAQHQFMLKHRPQSLLQRLIEPAEIANM